jgi:hypothetical protein
MALKISKSFAKLSFEVLIKVFMVQKLVCRGSVIRIQPKALSDQIECNLVNPH